VLKFLSFKLGLAECLGLLNGFLFAIGAFYQVFAERVEWGLSLKESEGAHWLKCMKLDVCFLFLLTFVGRYLSLFDIIEAGF